MSHSAHPLADAVREEVLDSFRNGYLVAVDGQVDKPWRGGDDGANGSCQQAQQACAVGRRGGPRGGRRRLLDGHPRRCQRHCIHSGQPARGRADTGGYHVYFVSSVGQGSQWERRVPVIPDDHCAR
ncbi:MAG: hypothetical protein Q4C85_00460 [Actinomyces sp.]|uniref:hypothetical protein n=1 Tax=Actinomyces sp. TaxID=29317 RepID=UPI0026DB0FC2|nr:hypothetical protein [Actinomyces sp.]MDO4242234.1 hypothetical protein [Actinomyces sp.]